MILVVYLAEQYLKELFKVTFNFYKVVQDVNFIEHRHYMHQRFICTAAYVHP
jgi:hypothetical protein